MNTLILCEGATDAILLSYYLIRVGGWSYSKKGPAGMKIKVDPSHQETAEWYTRGEDRLLICAVGSKSSFGIFFDRHIAGPLVKSEVESFSRVALLIDRDEESEQDITQNIRDALPMIAKHAENNVWVPHEYEGPFRQTKQLQFLLLIIPCDRQGALETLLLDAISEDPYDKNIVEQSMAYVDRIAPNADRYIGKRRLILKAYLGVTWAIQSPQKVFRFIDEQLREVPWETSSVLREIFQKLIEL